MEQLPNKQNDQLSKFLKRELLEEPSFDFTSKVMSKLEIASVAADYKYQPVISKKGWFVILAIISAIFAYAFLGSETSGSELISPNTIQKIGTAFTTAFYSSTMLYLAMLTSAVFVLIFTESVFRNNRLTTATSL